MCAENGQTTQLSGVILGSTRSWSERERPDATAPFTRYSRHVRLAFGTARTKRAALPLCTSLSATEDGEERTSLCVLPSR